MFFVDEPYISDFLKTTIKDHAIPTVATEVAQKLGLYPGTNLISEEQAIKKAQESDHLPIYTTSENSIGWIAKNLAFTDYPDKIELFKNKAKFRELTRSIFPDFFYREVRLEDLKDLRLEDLPSPFIIKPTVGFFSMGVHKVSGAAEWKDVFEAINVEMAQIKGLYPNEVLDIHSFIIEQCIDGEEFALDAYYNAIGKPVILNILSHAFSSDTDVSDRVYTTSKAIIERNLDEFTTLVEKIGHLAGVKNFPVHIELRRESDGTLLPIEVNPMRFGGWCSTPDLSYFAYGINPYTCYVAQQEPDWPNVLQKKEGKLFSVIVLDNSTGINVEQISSFDYEKLLSSFEKPIELRKIDYKKYSVFGFLFTETRADNFKELKNILDSDLKEFIRGMLPPS